MKPNYPPVSSNQEKYDTYHAQMDRLKLARDQGFFLEAIFILYAMLEDRLSSFLYHAGVTNNTLGKIATNKLVKPHLDVIFALPENKKYQLRHISVKIHLLKAVLDWSMSYTAAESSTTYPDVLYRQLSRTAGKNEMISVLEKMNDWCARRNELVHALLNKKLENQEDLLRSLVDEGYALCRKLDNFVRSFKVRNAIRKQFNIQ